MNNKISVVLGMFVVTALTLGFANFASASTYQFINTSGQLTSVTANSSTEALQTALNLGLHSGVMLVGVSTPTSGSGQVSTGQGLYLYQFINTSGQLVSVRANSSTEALQTALNLGLYSGVMLVQ